MAAGLCRAPHCSHAGDAGMPGAGTQRSLCPGHSLLPAVTPRHSRSAAGRAGKGQLCWVNPRSDGCWGGIAASAAAPWIPSRNKGTPSRLLKWGLGSDHSQLALAGRGDLDVLSLFPKCNTWEELRLLSKKALGAE